MTARGVSIGMPVFNGAGFIAEAIESLLAQSFEDFELIISDNASTDETEDICKRYAAADSRVRYVRQTSNLGAAANHNFVVHESKAPLFRWAAHDDLARPSLLERCVETLEENPRAVLAYPKSTVLTDSGEEPYDDGLDMAMSDPAERLFELVSKIVLCNPVYGVIRTDILRRTRLIGPFPSSDEVLLAELALMGPFVEVPEYLFVRRLHDGRSTAAHRSPEALSTWFDPARKPQPLHRTRVFGEEMRAVICSTLPVWDRARCAAGLARGYLPRWWRVMAREVQHWVLP